MSSEFGQSGIEQVRLQAAMSQSVRSDQYAKTEGERFQQLLAGHGPRGVEAAAMSDEQKIRQAAQQLVATTLIKPILASVRQDPFKSELFHGGRTEEAFGEQLDTIMADRMVSKQGFGLVDSVYKHFMRTIENQSAVEGKQGIDLHG